jgi:hypothetical protein
MRAHLLYLWFRLTSNLWVVPTAMIGAAALLALGMLYLDTIIPAEQLEPSRWVLRIGPEGARQVLATIAGSMISVASLVFSMTLVTLTLASSQLGPRLITRFVSDWVNQVVLGTFVATFVYAIVVLQTVSETAPEPFVPHLSIMAGLVLALISLLWLVYFIHHVASSIQADTVIAELGQQLSGAIEHRFPEIDLPEGGPLEAPFLDGLADRPGVIAAGKSGYVQVIDARALLRQATAHGLILKIDARPGDFVVERAPLLFVWPRERLSEDLRGDLEQPIVIGPKRTPTQDIDFAVAALVEIALPRAVAGHQRPPDRHDLHRPADRGSGGDHGGPRPAEPGAGRRGHHPPDRQARDFRGRDQRGLQPDPARRGRPRARAAAPCRIACRARQLHARPGAARHDRPAGGRDRGRLPGGRARPARSRRGGAEPGRAAPGARRAQALNERCCAV